jgi:hypothetical protein
MRFRIRGKRVRPGWDETYDEAVYVEAANADAAGRKAPDFVRVSEVREVPEDEGRGILWRLCRWLVRR